MDNGIRIGIEEFKQLKQKDQIVCLYENQVKTLELIKGYKFYYRLTMTIGSLLCSGLGFLFYYTFVIN
jgi:hypothetical protein